MAFTADNLRQAIKACRKNIKIFEEACVKERETIVEYQRQIRFLEEQEAIKQDVYNHVEVVRDDSQN